MPNKNTPHLGWYNRGYLPHFDQGRTYQFITYRLGDSLPKAVFAKYKILKENNKHDHHFHLEDSLDKAHGSCILKQKLVANIVMENWLHFHHTKYAIQSCTIMPNHVHILIQTFDGYALADIIHSWKSYTSSAINNVLGRTGSVWAREYWDRYIRNEDHYFQTMHYILQNPVKAGFCKTAKDWPRSRIFNNAG